MQLPADLRESAEAYQCVLDIPGLDKGDVKVRQKYAEFLIMTENQRAASIRIDNTRMQCLPSGALQTPEGVHMQIGFTLQIDVTEDRRLVISGNRSSDLHAGWEEKAKERCFGQFQRDFILADDDYSEILPT